VAPRAFLLRFLAPAVLAACGGSASPAASPIYSPPLTKADAEGPAVPPVYLRLAAPDRSVLERAADDSGHTGHTGHAGQWAFVCSSPCDGYVPALGSYRVSLPDRRVSFPFTLPGPPGTWVTLAVDGEGRVWTRYSVYLASQRTYAPMMLSIGRLR
jgi:hypothetical protein